MVIHYTLFKNKIVAGATDYVARVLAVDTADLEEVAELMVEHGSTVTKADILAVWEDTTKITEQLLRLGFRVNTGLCSVYPVIKGRFEDSDATFDPEIHKMSVGASPNARLKNYIQGKLDMEKEVVATTAPILTGFTDAKSGEMDSTLSIGSVGTIKGSNLKFEQSIPDEGVFLITDGQPEVRVDVIQKNAGTRVVFQIPETLLPGIFYQVEVRARYTDGGTLRVGTLLAELETPA